MLLAIIAFTASWVNGPKAAERPQDAIPIARSFLDAFASNVQRTENLVTTDAIFVMGDFGGPYARLLKALKTERGFSPSCHQTSLQQMGSVDLPAQDDLPPEARYLSGHFIRIAGHYDCNRPDGSKGSFKVGLLLKGNLVAKFDFGLPR